MKIQVEFFTSPWKWRQHSPQKRWYPTAKLHSVTTQKTSITVSCLFYVLHCSSICLGGIPRNVVLTFTVIKCPHSACMCTAISRFTDTHNRDKVLENGHKQVSSIAELIDFLKIWMPSETFVESPYYSESELCGGAVTVSLFPSISLGKRCTSYNAPPTSRKRTVDRWSLRNFLPLSSIFMVGKAQKSHGARSGLYGGCSYGVLPIHFFQDEHRIQFRSRPMRFLSSEAKNFEVINGLQHVFEKWVERCKKCFACQGRYFEKETVTAPPQSSDSE
jgi:hypothetical protein